MVVRVGPFKRIVGVHWPEPVDDLMILDAHYFYYGDAQQGEDCSYDEWYEWFISGVDDRPEVSSTGYSANTRVKPGKFFAETDGIEGVSLADVTISGVPIDSGHSFGSWGGSGGNSNDAYSDLSVTYEESRFQLVSGSAFGGDAEAITYNPDTEKLCTPSLTFSLWSPNYTTGSMCRVYGEFDPSPHVLRGIDGGAYSASWPERAGHCFQMCTSTMDFSGVSIVNNVTGRTYNCIATIIPKDQPDGCSTIKLVLVPASS